MNPAALFAIGCFWLAGVAWIVWAAHTAPVLEEPVGWLTGIQPASISDLDESVADDFALDLEQLRSLRSFNLAEWQ